MTKDTNPGWPDPSSWANELASLLKLRGAHYDAAADVHDKQLALSTLLAQLTKHINQLPIVENRDLLLPLMHLSDALAQASEGHKPPLFSNRRANPSRRSSVYWMTAKIHAVLAYHTLLDAGHPSPAAIVAGEMNKAALSRRKGERQTARSVERFVDHYAVHAPDADAEAWVIATKSKIAAFRSNPDWPVTIADALDYTRRVFASKRLKPFIPNPQS